MNRTEAKDGKAVFWAAPMLLGLLLIFGGTLAGAAFLSSGALGQQLAPLAAYVPLALGGFVAALWGARRAPAQKFPMGMLVGLLLLGCLFVLGLTIRDAAFLAPAAGMTSGVLLIASLLGAILGVTVKKKKRRR
ncbi:MAG: TIGR04086 family membrane protein [Eubacteriales bacterium]|nr:TIGR04086 family membrane protein [Eubacteriales bacterium]